jgi:hypothetical protein
MRPMRTVPFILGLVLCTPWSATAQQIMRAPDRPGWSFVPVFQTIGLYESNVLFTAGLPSSGTFMRLSPSLETRYRGPVGKFRAGYSVDSEFHSESLQNLDEMFARQVGAMSFESKTSERGSFSGMARYISTLRPEEILDVTGLVGTERRTTNFLTSLTAQHKLSTVSHADFEYSLSLDDFGSPTENIPGARSLLHALTSGVTFGRAERTSVAVEHTAKLLIGENETVRVLTSGTYWSNDVVARLTRSLTPHLSAILAGGPRLSQTVPVTIDPRSTSNTRWELQPELQAALRYKNPDHVWELEYRRTQALGYGASGFIDTDSIEIRSAHALGRRMELTTRPGLYRNELAGLAATGYRLEGTVRYAATSWVSIDAMFSSRHQEGTLALADLSVRAVTRSRTRNRIAFGATVRRPTRAN